jgi:hypothetical protein
MMSIEAGRYYGLNAVASRIWELLDAPRTIPQLCEQLVGEFEVDALTCEAAVRNFVGELINNGVVHASEG